MRLFIFAAFDSLFLGAAYCRGVPLDFDLDLGVLL